MNRVMQSFNFVLSSSSLSSLLIVVVDLRLLISKSLSLGVGIGEPVSICCQNLLREDKNGCSRPIHITFSSFPAVKTLAAIFNLSMNKSASLLTSARDTEKWYERKRSLANTRRSIDFGDTSPGNAGRWPRSRRYCII